jgi:hypothetical protein
MRKINTISYLAILLGCVASLASVSEAQDYDRQRKAAMSEIKQFFNKQFVVTGTPVRNFGPEWLNDVPPWLAGKKVVGCPAQSLTPVTDSKQVIFRSTRPTQWAGGLDGLNVPTRNINGAKGGGLAVPRNSTARLNTPLEAPEFEYEFNGIWDVRRGLVDAAAEEFARCFNTLPPGAYEVAELQRLCPYREVTREQQGQTCVASVQGVIGKPLNDGSGYEASIIETTFCDFVGVEGYSRSNEGFNPCYFTEYRGVAQISSDFIAPTETQVKISAAKKRLVSRCAKGGSKSKRRPAKIRSCVASGMARAMAGVR